MGRQSSARAGAEQQRAPFSLWSRPPEGYTLTLTSMACPMRFLLLLVSVVVALFVVGKSTQTQTGAATTTKTKTKRKELLSFGWEAFSGLYLWRIYKQHHHQKV